MRATLMDMQPTVDSSRPTGDRMVDHLVDNARTNLVIARRLLMMSCPGFAASHVQMAMQLLGAALVYAHKRVVLSDPALIVVELNRIFPEQLSHYIRAIEIGSALAMAPESEDYVPPPSTNVAAAEITLAEDFLGDVVGYLGVPSRVGTP